MSYLWGYVKGMFNSVLGYLGLYNKKASIVFLGLDNAGKSALLHVLKTDRVTQTRPTIHPHSEELKMGNIVLNTFDLEGMNKPDIFGEIISLLLMLFYF